MRRSRVPCWVLVGLLGIADAALTVARAQDQKVRGSAVEFRQNPEVLILYKEGQADQARQLKRRDDEVSVEVPGGLRTYVVVELRYGSYDET